MTNAEIKKAKEFYGIYDYVSDENVTRLCENVKNHPRGGESPFLKDAQLVPKEIRYACGHPVETRKGVIACPNNVSTLWSSTQNLGGMRKTGLRSRGEARGPGQDVILGAVSSSTPIATGSSLRWKATRKIPSPRAVFA